MIQVKSFTFNPFQENTYVLFDDQKNGIVFDPGMHNPNECTEFDNFITTQGIKLSRLINTHCHLDHIFGNQHIFETYTLAPEFHKGEFAIYDAAQITAMSYGLPPFKTPNVKSFLDEKDSLILGDVQIAMMLTPGHSPASLSFYLAEQKILIAGDVLFQGSIGRTDLPGGDYNTLINSIVRHFLTLDDEVVVFSGHGPKTTIGRERKTNPFLQSLN